MEKLKTNLKADVFSKMFQFQDGIYNNVLDGLSEDMSVKRVLEKSNHTNWLLGHILHCRFMLANMLGIKAENPFGKIYWEKIEEKKYPGLKDVAIHFPIVSEKLILKLSEMNDDELDSKPAEGKPSLAEIISFFAYHEAYHIGQLGMVRKLIGLESLKSN